MIASVIMIGVISISFAYICTQQQNTINDLTNKLMAKDYREYKVLDRPPEPDPVKTVRKSWASNRDIPIKKVDE